MSHKTLTNHQRDFFAPWQQFFLEEASLLSTSWVPAINHVDRALRLTSRIFHPASRDVARTGETTKQETGDSCTFQVSIAFTTGKRLQLNENKSIIYLDRFPYIFLFYDIVYLAYGWQSAVQPFNCCFRLSFSADTLVVCSCLAPVKRLQFLPFRSILFCHFVFVILILVDVKFQHSARSFGFSQMVLWRHLRNIDWHIEVWLGFRVRAIRPECNS